MSECLKDSSGQDEQGAEHKLGVMCKDIRRLEEFLDSNGHDADIARLLATMRGHAAQHERQMANPRGRKKRSQVS